MPKRAQIKDKHGKWWKPPGTKPTIATVEVDETKERWRYPTPPKDLDEEQKRRVSGAVISQLVTVIFSHHYYEINREIHRQVKGGPTGLRPTGPVSRIVLDWVISQIKEISTKSEPLHAINPVMFSKLTVYELKKYVDDMFSVTNTLSKGTRWDSSTKSFIWNHEIEKNETMTPAQITCKAFAKMASSVMSGSLNFTWDTPCSNKSGRLPVLDTCLWIGPQAREKQSQLKSWTMLRRSQE